MKSNLNLIEKQQVDKFVLNMTDKKNSKSILLKYGRIDKLKN